MPLPIVWFARTAPDDTISVVPDPESIPPEMVAAFVIAPVRIVAASAIMDAPVLIVAPLITAPEVALSTPPLKA